MRQQIATAFWLLLAFGMSLPVLGVAETSKKLPMNYLAVASLESLAQTPEYAKLDSHYEKYKRDKGDVWINSPEGKAMAEVREYLRRAALSADIETIGTRKSVVFTQGPRKAVLGSFVPPKADDKRDIEGVADTIAGLIIDRARDDAKYKAVMAAIDAVENPPLPDINHSSAPMVLGAFVEPQAPYPLWLPQPGPSSKADLHPRAEEARQRGLKAASNGDWPGAVAAFKEANSFAHCSPPLMFNLGLAYQRGGWPVQAAMYYRAYVTALPDAPNAAEVRAEVKKLIAETEARSLREFNEAEHLADKLSATQPSAGARSLRQIALEDMATYAYMGGLVDRGDALALKASSLPGASSAVSKSNWDKHGLYGALYSWDAKHVDDIIARSGKDYDESILGRARINAYWPRGDLAQVRRLVDEHSSFQLRDSFWGLRHRSYDVLETLFARNLATAKAFDAQWYKSNLMSGLEAAFWDGRPDVARRLASQAVVHYRKYNLEYYRTAFPQMTASFVIDGKARERAYSYGPLSWDYIVPSAVLGDRNAVQQEIRRWVGSYTGNGDFADGNADGNAALLLVSSMSTSDAAALIEKMIQWRFKPSHEGDITISESQWPLHSPLTYFALAVSRGDSLRALKYLDHGRPVPADKIFPTDDYYQNDYRLALRFAVATGRSQLALDLAKRVSTSKEGLLAMNRLALNPGADESVRERVRRYAASVSGGWRPIDANHAKKVWLLLDHAMWLNDEAQYGSLPADAEKIAKEEPEKLPAHLAGHALVLWMGAMAARLED